MVVVLGGDVAVAVVVLGTVVGTADVTVVALEEVVGVEVVAAVFTTQPWPNFGSKL